MSDETDARIERMLARARELRAQGLDPYHASGLANLELRLEFWPSGWAPDSLHVLVYGDFEPPPTDVEIHALGIRVGSQKREGTVISDALTVVEAQVAVAERSLAAVLEASRRMNVCHRPCCLSKTWRECYELLVRPSSGEGAEARSRSPSCRALTVGHDGVGRPLSGTCRALVLICHDEDGQLDDDNPER